MNQPIFLIGAGRMGGALLRGWINNNVAPLVVVEPQPLPSLRRLAKSGVIELHRRVEEVPCIPRACVVALKPQILKSEASKLRPFSDAGAVMISIAAGTNAKTLARTWGRAARIVRAMPNTPGAIGRGISALYAARNARPADRRLAESLLLPLGETLWVNCESLIDTVTAVSGSGPAYVFLLVEALADAAEMEGLSRIAAERLARATIVGAGALLDTDRRSARALRLDVTSPKGTTEAALDVLLGKKGLMPLIARAVHAARTRAKELGR